MQTFLVDIERELVERGRATIEKSLSRFVKKEKITPEQAAEISGRVTPTTDDGCFAQCDLIVEAVTEDAGLKTQIFATAESSQAFDPGQGSRDRKASSQNASPRFFRRYQTC